VARGDGKAVGIAGGRALEQGADGEFEQRTIFAARVTKGGGHFFRQGNVQIADSKGKV
jgi:hypothetical protein